MTSVVEKIPVREVAGSAIGFAWNNFFTLVRIGWFPVLISSFFSYVGNLPLDPAAPVWAAEINPTIFQVSYVLAFVCWAIFAVAVHRMILVEDGAPSGIFYFRVTGDEIRYALAPLFMGLIPLAIIALGAFFLLGQESFANLQNAGEGVDEDIVPFEPSGWQIAAFALSVLVAIFVYVRLLLSLPIIAAENRFGLWRSWSLTSGNFWRLILVHVLVILTYLLFIVVVAFAFASLGFAGAGLGVSSSDGGFGTSATIATVVTGIGTVFFLNYLFTVTFIAVLSFSYQALTDEGVSAGERIRSLKSSGGKA